MSTTAASGPVGASGAESPGARVHTHTVCLLPLQPTVKAAIETIADKA